MRPIDIQNAIDRVQAGERLLHARKVEDSDEKERFAKRLDEEVQQKKSQVNDPEQAEGLKIDGEEGGKSQYEGRKKKKKQQEEDSSQEEEKKVKEDGKGNILDLNA